MKEGREENLQTQISQKDCQRENSDEGSNFFKKSKKLI